jgi:RHS repeat-associated protein
VIEFHQTTGEDRQITRTLHGPGVDNVLAVDWRSEDATGEPTATKVVWTLTDYQGSLGDLASKAGEQLTTHHMEYTVYGEPEDPSGLAVYVDSFYAGREYDDDTGLYHNRARWYDPAAGRFISEDPIGFAGGDANLYRYAANSPTNLTDPTGHFLWMLALLVLGGEFYGIHKAREAEAQFNEAYDLISQAELSQADAARVEELVGSAEWNLATAEITKVGAEAFSAGAFLGWFNAATTPLGSFGMGLRIGLPIGLVAPAVPAMVETAMAFPQMSAVDKYRVGGSVIAAGFAGPAGYRATYRPSLAAVRRGLLHGRPGGFLQSAYRYNLERGLYGRGFRFYNATKATVAPTRLPTKAQHPDASVLPRHPSSRPISSSTEPGEYVFAQDGDGVVHVVPSGPHLHPTVLGGGKPAAASGEIVIGSNGVVTEINNISFTFQHDASVLPGVKRALEQAGLRVAPDAIKPFTF